MHLITRIVTHTENKRKRQAVAEAMRETMFAVEGKKKAVCVCVCIYKCVLIDEYPYKFRISDSINSHDRKVVSS